MPAAVSRSTRGGAATGANMAHGKGRARSRTERNGRLPAALFWAVCLAVRAGAPAGAQTSASAGAVEGWVFDESQGAVGGARVEARNRQTGLARAAESDASGYYRIAGLVVGPYDIEVASPGFAPLRRQEVVVSLGSTARIDVHLQVASQAQQVTVSEAPPLIDPAQTSMTSSVGRERIEESPVRTRNALDFVLLEPNVAPAGAGGAGGAASGGLATSGFSFGGMRPTSNRIAIDGMENDDEFSGGSRTELSPEIVQEFQVVNNGISAESGGASGGAVNIVTRSGVNATHGDAFVFAQTGALDARPPVEEAPAAPDLNRYRAGSSNGGAIVRDRTFYYAAVEQEHERSQVAADIDPATLALVNRALAAALYPAFPVRALQTGFAPTAHAETEASARIDQQWSQRSVMSLRYALTNNREAGDAYNNTGLEDASGRGNSFLFDQSLAGSWTLTAGPDAVNQLRAQMSRRSAALRPNQTAGPEMVIDGLADFGQPYQGSLTYREEHADAADTYSWNRGRHLVQMGAAVNYVHESAVNRYGEGGLWLFPDMTAFLAGQAVMYRQMFGAPAAAFGAASLGGFVQDHFVVNRHLTVDAGLRYDFEQLPYGFREDPRNFSPRVGIALSPASRLVVRAGYGIFFDRYVLSALDQAVTGGLQGFEQVLEGPPAGALLLAGAGAPPLIPRPLPAPSVYRADPALATPYSQQASAGLQYAPASDITASANYLFVRGVRLPRTRNVNLPPPAALAGEPVFSGERLNPAFDGIYQIEDTANSTYNGLSLALRIMKEDFTLDASYTVSRVTDDASSWAEQPQNPYAAWQDRALSLYDVPRRFVMSGLFDLPIGPDEGASQHARRGFWVNLFSHIELAPILTAESARPANPLTGVDSFGTESYPLSARPLGFGRNSLRIPALTSIDLRILKAIPMGESRHLDLVAESFNLLNHTNVTAIDPFFGAGAAAAAWFGRPIDALAGRQVQFSIDFEF